MVHKILNRFTGKILFECECENLKTCVEIAVKKKINLDYAFFDRASLDGASFDGAFLDGSSFDRAKNIIVIEWRGFSFHTQKEKTKIGCEYRSNKEWLEMSKEKAVELGIKEEDFEDYRKILKMGIYLLK